MDTNKFYNALNGAEVLLERIYNRVKSDDDDWIAIRARAGLERARAELAQTRKDIFWQDKDLPF